MSEDVVPDHPSAGRRPRARRTALRVAGGVVAVVVVLGAYAVADVVEVVPGPLTVEAPPDPDPWPDPPGAELPPVAPDDVLAPASAGPPPRPEALSAVLAPLLASPGLGPSRSASVVDAVTGEVLLDDGAAVGRQPASTAKLLTGAAALSVLGAGTTLPTTVVDGASAGEVVLVGGGDVLLAAGAGDPSAVVGRAGLADLADAVAATLLEQGRTSVAVRLDDALFTGPPTAPGWSAGDVDLGFVAPVTALAVDAGRVGPGEYALRVPDPSLDAARTFADLLAARGVAVAGDVQRAAAPPEAAVLGQVRSATVAEVAGHALLVSENTVAEALARLVAAGSGRPADAVSAPAAVVDAVRDLGVGVDGVVLADASGLADGSSVPAGVVTALLAAAAGAPVEATGAPDPAAAPGAADRVAVLRPLLAGLPVAGLRGSLAGRYDDEPAARGVVRAKTGTLTGVTGLAGTTVDADGRLLAFAVLADATPSAEPARDAVDRVAAALTACGCR